jgi:hypothetical protein
MNSKAAPLQPGDEIGLYTYAQLLRMDRRYVAAAEQAIRLGLERRTSASPSSEPALAIAPAAWRPESTALRFNGLASAS